MRFIFERYLEGDSLGKIVDALAQKKSFPHPIGGGSVLIVAASAVPLLYFLYSLLPIKSLILPCSSLLAQGMRNKALTLYKRFKKDFEQELGVKIDGRLTEAVHPPSAG
ncbi:hypothetical protein [Desulfitobacterium hafniense]|uniref:hypothetical protein n=1 Tax=Desulfitobacterium hafniense TaxID=49338 RepID=UPI00037A07DE|nr:hypothetical protein [Desulfitobacterium hafniense]